MQQGKADKREAMLSGPPLKTLLGFSVPIILGNIFQQLYNIVDAVVVGNFLGDRPLAGISIASGAIAGVTFSPLLFRPPIRISFR